MHSALRCKTKILYRVWNDEQVGGVKGITPGLTGSPPEPMLFPRGVLGSARNRSMEETEWRLHRRERAGISGLLTSLTWVGCSRMRRNWSGTGSASSWT